MKHFILTHHASTPNPPMTHPLTALNVLGVGSVQSEAFHSGRVRSLAGRTGHAQRRSGACRRVKTSQAWYGRDHSLPDESLAIRRVTHNGDQQEVQGQRPTQQHGTSRLASSSLDDVCVIAVAIALSREVIARKSASYRDCMLTQATT